MFGLAVDLCLSVCPSVCPTPSVSVCPPVKRVHCTQVAQLSQRDRTAGRVSYGQKWKTGTGDNIYGLYRSIYNHCDVLASKEIEIGEKTPNKGYYAVQGHPRSSKVIEVGTNRKPLCDFLLVINNN